MSDQGQTDVRGNFPTTQWTQIIAVIQQGEEEAASHALGEFCEHYRPAILNFFRRRGCEDQKAQDYTQEFFLSRIHKRWDAREGFLFDARRRENSRFRVFLSTVLRAFLIDKWRVKRPDGAPAVSERVDGFNFDLQPDPAADGITHDLDYALAVDTIRQAIDRSKPSPQQVGHLKGEITQAEAAAALGISEGAFRVSYFRFRERFREELLALVRKQVSDDFSESDVEGELRYYLSLFAKPRA